MKRILFLLYYLILGTSCSLESVEDQVRRKYTNQEFSGVIKEAYFQVNDGGRGAPKLILRDGSIHPSRSAWLICYADPGDSIIKEKGHFNTY